MQEGVDCCVQFLSCYYITQCLIYGCGTCCGETFDDIGKTDEERRLEARYGPRANPIRNQAVPVAPVRVREYIVL